MSSSLNIDIEILDHASDLPIPKYQTEGAAGMDLYAALSKPIVLRPLERTLIPTGLKISLPKKFRSSNTSTFWTCLYTWYIDIKFTWNN